MIRLTEASARLRLSSVAEKQDAQKAANIMVNCLKKVGVDPETGNWDIGMIELGNTKRSMDRTRKILETIRELSKHHLTGVPLEEIGRESGIEADKVTEIVDRLRCDGDIYLRGQDKYFISGE
jgi:replicative DNA helicase Mcm